MIEISEADLHPHLKARMSQRGITIEEIERVLIEGGEATDAKPGTKPGTLGKVFVFLYNRMWEGKLFEEKEVSVYYRLVNNRVSLLTVKARYGKGF